MNERLQQSLEFLGLRADASLEKINATYYMILKGLPKNPTEEEEEYQKQVMQAYAFIKRSYVPAPTKRRKVRFDQALLGPILGTVAVVAALSLLVINFGSIKVMMTRHQAGVMLRWRNQTEPYGQVLAYEPHHQFEKGDPFAAYQIRLAARDETVWLSENLVVRGMVPVDDPGGSIQPASAAPRN